MTDEAALAAFRGAASRRTIHKIDRAQVAAEVKRSICGQDDTIDLMVEQIRNGFASNPKRREGPVGVFMLLGPPGTGKTSLARVLAEAVIGKDDGFCTVDMNSCRDQHAAWTYFGSAQGYAGGRGILTSAIDARRGGPMLILLDEFEKADSTVHRMFLNAWATGFIVDNRDGKQIDTRNTIWVLTSNAATKKVQDLKKAAGADRDLFNEEVRSVLLSNPENPDRPLFAPEVLSRVNEFFCLEPLAFAEQDEEGVLVGFQLIRNMLTKLAAEYDLTLAAEDIDPDAVGSTLHMLTTTFGKSGIRALRVWLKRQLSSNLVDLCLAEVGQVRIEQIKDAHAGEVRLRAVTVSARRST